MHIGLMQPSSVSFFRAGGKLPCAPEMSSGRLLWKWASTMLTAVEIHAAYDKPVFIASVRLQLAGAPLRRAEVLIPELDARQNATINVIDSIIYDEGGNSIIKSYAWRNLWKILRDIFNSYNVFSNGGCN